MVERQRVLSALLVLLVLLALALLWEVAATVFFAVTVAYVLAPVRRHHRDGGASRRVASATATFAGFVGTLAVFSPIGALLFLRLDDFLEFLGTVPEEVTITVWEFSTTLVTEEVTDRAAALLAATARSVGAAMPVLLILGLFAYHLLLGQVTHAIALFLVGGFLIAWAPDLFIRPRLAAETARIPATLYFIGFVGGVLTVGTIGVIAGPLVIAVAAEVAGQLAAEFNAVPVHEE